MSRSASKKPQQDAHFEGKEYALVSNYGAEKRAIFSSQQDYDRFEAYLHVLNAVESPRAANIFAGKSVEHIFESTAAERLVAIGAYSLTPKGFLILLTPNARAGTARFMQKLQTAYTMYFNKKYAHAGRLFHGPYITERAISERHLKYLVACVHLEPARLFNANWEAESPEALRSLAFRILKYRYSSIGEYISGQPRITELGEFPRYISAAKNPDTLLKFWMQYRGLVIHTNT